MLSGYNKVMLSADCVLVSNEKVLMIKRAIDPYKDQWVLPGGHIESKETVEEALKREVLEETNINVDDLKIIGVYSEPDRDPRGRTISCAYFADDSEIGEINLNEESDDFKFFDFDNLPDNIGFDHRKIIEDAYKKFIS